MAKYDGSIKFDTKIDTREFESGVDKLKNTAVKGFAAVGAAAAGGIAAAAKAGMDFEEAMSSVAAISMATGEQYDMLKAKAQEMGETTKFTATQAANALEYLSLAGYTAEESCAALPQVLNLAAAGGMDLAYASDLLTDSMAVMGLGIDSMANFSDQLAMAASKSNTSVQQLGEAVLVTGGQAKLANMSVEEMNTALGILADKGIKGSEGGTALRNTLKNLYTPTKNSADMLERLGVKTADAQGNLIPMQTVLKNLNTALGSLTEADKMNAMGEIFDTRTIAAASALLDDCGSRWDELSGYLSDCDGAAEQMAETMNDNLTGQLTLAASAAEGLGIAVYDSISGTLKESVKSGAAEISALTRSIKGGELKPAIESVGKLFAGLADTTVNLASAALPPLISVLGFVGNNMRLITTAATAAVAAYKSFTIVGAVTKLIQANTAALAAHKTALAAAAISGTAYAGQLTLQQTVIGVLTGKIKLAAAAQALWNAAMNASPVGLAIGGAVALGVAIAGVVAWANKETEAEKEKKKAIEESSTAIESAKQAYDEYRQSKQSTTDASVAEITNAENLYSQLNNLADASGHVDESNRARAAFILGELNKALGTEYTMTDGVIQNYASLKQSIYDVIEAKKLQILMSQAEENYANSVKNMADAQAKYAEAYRLNQEQNTEETRKNLAEAQSLLDKYMNDQIAYQEAFALSAQGATGEAIRYLEEYNAAYSNAAGASQNYADNTAANLERLGSAYESSLIILQSALDKYNETGSDAAKSIVESCLSSVIKARDQFAQAGGEISNEFIAGINSTNVDLGVLSANMQYALQNISIETVKVISDTATNLGKAAEQAKTGGISFSTSYTQGISQNASQATQAATDLGTGAVTSLGAAQGSTNGASTETEALGGYFAVGFANGMKNNQTIVSSAAAALAQSANAAARNALEIHSPSRVGVEIGKYFDLGVAKGIEKNSESVVGSAKAMSEKLGYLKDFDLISEDEYYTKLEEIRDRYFAAGTKEWIDYTKKIYDYQKKFVENEKKKLEDEKKNISKIYDDIADYASKKLDEVIKKQESYDKKLMNFGSGLLTKNTIEFGDEKIEFYSLKDLHADIDAMREYNDMLASFRGRLGASGLGEDIQKSLLDEIDSMNNTEAKEFMKLLNAANNEDYADYISVYGEKFKFAQKASAQIYDSEMTKAVDDSYKYMTDKLSEAGYEIPEGFFTSGTVSAEKFGSAFVEELDTQLSKIRAKIDAFNASLKIELNESSRDRRSGGNKTVSYDYSDNSSIVIHGSSGSSVRENIQQAKNLKTYWAHTARSTTKATRKG